MNNESSHIHDGMVITFHISALPSCGGRSFCNFPSVWQSAQHSGWSVVLSYILRAAASSSWDTSSCDDAGPAASCSGLRRRHDFPWSTSSRSLPSYRSNRLSSVRLSCRSSHLATSHLSCNCLHSYARPCRSNLSSRRACLRRLQTAASIQNSC